MQTSAKLALLGTLYVSQGLPFGFFIQAVPAVMRQQGSSLTTIGLTTLLAMPWALKALWAPWVDRGPRRRRIVPLQLASSALLVVLAGADPRHALPWLLVGVSISNLLSATQDIATDGLAVDLLRPNERGLGNGVQVAAYRFGMVLGGGALLVALDHVGWMWTLMGAAVLLLLATVPVAWFREPPRRVPTTDAEVVDAWRWFVGRPDGGRWVLALVVYKAGDHLGTGMLRPYFIDRGATLSELGVMLGGIGFTAGLLGAVLGGACVQRWGRRHALLGFGLAQAVSVAGYALLSTGALGLDDWLAVVVEHLATGMATAALFTVMMDRCRPDRGGTDYTLQASVVVLATGLAAALGGPVAEMIGYTSTFVVGGLVCAVAVVIARSVHFVEDPAD